MWAGIGGERRKFGVGFFYGIYSKEGYFELILTDEKVGLIGQGFWVFWGRLSYWY